MELAFLIGGVLVFIWCGVAYTERSIDKINLKSKSNPKT